jgi:hypothetical protein
MTQPTIASDHDLLTMKAHLPTDGWIIMNGRGERFATTMLPPSEIMGAAPGKTMTEKLRWVIETGQVMPEDRWL